MEVKLTHTQRKLLLEVIQKTSFFGALTSLMDRKQGTFEFQPNELMLLKTLIGHYKDQYDGRTKNALDNALQHIVEALDKEDM